MKKAVAFSAFVAGLLTGTLPAGMAPAVATVYTDENGFDTTPEGTASSTTYVPGDYCIIDLATGATTIRRNVTDPTIFNVDAYKTTNMVFRYVPEGKFKMKASRYTTKEYETTNSYDMELSAYWICLFELTEAQFNMLKATPGTGTTKAKSLDRGEYKSVVGKIAGNGTAIERDLSNSFLEALNNKIAASAFANKIEICTQCQWERAARAGTRSDCFFSEEPCLTSTTLPQEINTYGWYSNSNYTVQGGSGKREPQKVGLLSPNPWGLWDVYGNVPELCLDAAVDLPEALSTLPKDWVDCSSNNYRINRGGYFNSLNRSSKRPFSR